MHAVNLCRELVLESPDHVADGAGGFTQTWTALGSLWAEVKSGSGRTPRDDLGPVSQVSYRITVRAAPYGAPSRPKPNQRLRDGERIFVINAVADSDVHGAYLPCFATEEVAS